MAKRLMQTNARQQTLKLLILVREIKKSADLLERTHLPTYILIALQIHTRQIIANIAAGRNINVSMIAASLSVKGSAIDNNTNQSINQSILTFITRHGTDCLLYTSPSPRD